MAGSAGPACSVIRMAEMIARVRKEMQDRLKEIESELASVEALIAEKARLEHALATPPFADAEPAKAAAAPAKRRKPARARAPRGREPRRGPRRAGDDARRHRRRDLGRVRRRPRPGLRAAARGVEKGELTLVELAAGQMGYRIASKPETAFPDPAGRRGADARSLEAPSRSPMRPSEPAAEREPVSLTHAARFRA